MTCGWLFLIMCVSAENFVQFVAGGRMCVHNVEKIACNVCLNDFAKWGIEPNDIVLPIPAGLLRYMRHLSLVCVKLLCPSAV